MSEEFKKLILNTIICDKCGRYSTVYGKLDNGRQICVVCILRQMQQESRPKVGPSEVKYADTKAG